VVRTTPNGFVVVWWHAGLCLCRACCCLVAKEAHLGQRTRPVASLWRVKFL
jgi:hypothetical protein